MNDWPPYSVLMSVYAKGRPEELRLAMDSMWGQTVSPDEFVLVCDGPLTTELNKIIDAEMKAHSEQMVVCRLQQNQGLGKALNIGLAKCSNELIARMDADDISRANRCELQLRQFLTQPNIVIVSGTVQEFSLAISDIESERKLPRTHAEIVSFAKSRNPFNHPCVMYRKSAVEAAGGYVDFYLLEDYYLWIRMLQDGCMGYNLEEPLLWMRAGSELYARRSGPKYAKSQASLFRYMLDTNFITRSMYRRAIVSRSLVAMAPNNLRKVAYRILAR